MSKRIEQIVRDPVTGDGVNAVTVTVKKVSDDSSVDSVATNSDGVATFSVTEIGNPGPVYSEFTDGTNVKRRSGEVIGQVGGFLWVDAINDAFAAFGESRVIAGYLNELVCAANGSNMLISVATGAAILKEGFVYHHEDSENLTIGAADVSNPRIDRIILRLKREAESDRGTLTLMVLAGTPAASPVAPSLTQSSTTWEISLAQVLVDAGTSSIAVGKVTDERAFTLTPPASLASGDIFYVNASKQLTRLAKGTNGQYLTLSSGLPAWATISSPVTNQALTFMIGNGVDVITTGTKGAFYIPRSLSVTGWKIVSVDGTSGSIVVDLMLETDSNMPHEGTETITGSEKPTLSAGTSAEDLTLSTWTDTSWSADDWIIYEVESASSVKLVAVTILFTG